MEKELTYIDLFAGAGGLSEGFLRNGFKAVSHVEMNKDACDTLRTRIAYHFLKENNQTEIYTKYLQGEIDREGLWAMIPQSIIGSVIHKEISESTVSDIFEKIDKQIGEKTVDLIIGGPPCQAYSVAGRARDPLNMQKDPRNFLYKYYLEFLKKYKPKVFVFENVPGILSAKNGVHLKNILNGVEKAGYEVQKPSIFNSKDFGVLQDRKRVIIVGLRKDLKLQYPVYEQYNRQWDLQKALLSDLPKLQQGEGVMGIVKYINPSNEYLIESKIRTDDKYTIQHIVRPNNNVDLSIYKIAVDLWLNKGKRLNYSELPKHLIKHNNVKSFTNRFQVVNHKGVSHTVVAHIAMDGHYYIYPSFEQVRSISIREAARIQSFPDNYFFEGSRTAVFKQIGNAVPPLMAEKIAKQIKNIMP